MPNTCAFASFSRAIESRNVHSSFWHTELNAAGKERQHDRLAALLAERDRLAVLVRQREVRGFRSNVCRHEASMTSVDKVVRPGYTFIERFG